MKYTIEIIVGDKLIERIIECDYLNTVDGVYDFIILGGYWECECGTKHSLNKSVGSYPKNMTIIKNVEQ
jgi:hypothetical protein